ncbi:MAG: RT0821/Lpp0805 family surface protein [Alphaproteobacteria bacterium]|nr:RT0821/Lpp0805 family surface protein [Alphaproteobacteria bacterium]
MFRRGRAVIPIVLAGLALGACGQRAGAPAAVTNALDPTDRTLAAETLQDTLEHARTGERLAWSNTESGNGGSAMAIRTYESSAVEPCREFQTTATVGGTSETTFGAACREPDGNWTQIGTAEALARHGRYLVSASPYYRYPRRYGTRYRGYWDYGYPYFWHFPDHRHGSGFHFSYGHRFGYFH